MTYIVGMIDDRADKTRDRTADQDWRDRLQTAGIGAFFRPSQLEMAGMTRDQLPALVRSGKVERIGRGLYRFADVEPTENYSLAMACARVPHSVVCLLSALRVHGIGTQAPAEVWLAIPHKARAPRLRELRLRIVRFSGSARDLPAVSADYFPPLGEGQGYTGLELLLLSLAACSATAIVPLLPRERPATPPRSPRPTPGTSRCREPACSSRTPLPASGSSTSRLQQRARFPMRSWRTQKSSSTCRCSSERCGEKKSPQRNSMTSSG